ncbi:protein-tyrosine phosphatase-like protein [Zychaea mexicana]|uniref:protein-tyrosine phosphatase-like protein n=1 Tax=Zychaea mexicana TaxID=64656 RepID=UPI0022FDF984|nr:protein-tyrosine phosphatase-like protein [Zychaea mexicana]KAI9488221.1 protein-tyrosine phosphatase-like protein [Zychaea mexicana]
MFFDLTPNQPQQQPQQQQQQQQGPYQHGPLQIMPHLYLGAEDNALDLDRLRRLSIDCMLNVAEEVVHPQERQFVSFESMFERPASSSVMPSPSLSRASTASSIASSLHTITPLEQHPSSPRWFDKHEHTLLLPGAKKQRQASVSSIGSVCDSLYNTSHGTSTSNRLATLNTLCEKQNMAYKKLPWKHNQDNLVNELDAAIAAIDRARDAGHTILVHCQCGVARSATVIIAYIMKTMKLPMQEAYDYVKAQAPGISPNLALLYQLREYEQKLSHLRETLRSSSTSLRPSTLCDRPYHQHQPQPTTPKTPSSPKKPLFLFRKSSLSLSWKRRMGKFKQDDKASDFEGWWKSKKQQSSVSSQGNNGSKVTLRC